MGNVHMEASQINYRGGETKMSVEEAIKAGSSYTLPIASAETLGGVKIGSGISIAEGGAISADAQLPEDPETDGVKVLTATTTSGETVKSWEDPESELPANPLTDGVKVLTATTTSGETVLSWEEPASGFNMPMPYAYGTNSGIGSASAKCNYWFGIYASSGHQIPAISAGSNCTVAKVVDHSESVEDAFALYKIEKTNASTGATINEANIDAKVLFGISEFYNLGEFVKSAGNVGKLEATTNKPILVCMQSGLSSGIYPIVGTVTKGKDATIARCQYGSYDNAEVHIIFPEDGEIDVTFTHNTIFAYAEISESEE